MYRLTEQQTYFILSDIRARGVELEELQLQLLDHVCCIVERHLEEDGDFESFYNSTIKTFYKKELREIEEETIYLLTNKNYNHMKKIIIATGTASVAAFILGSVFKFMLWQGAAFFIVFGAFLFAALFLPLAAFSKIREAQTGTGKLTIAVGTLAAMVFCAAVIFSIMHWPGARSGTLWFAFAALSLFVVVPAYFFHGIRQPETRMNTVFVCILLAGITGLQFTMVNLHPSAEQPVLRTYTYLQSTRYLKQVQDANTNNNKDVASINATCEQIKRMILQNEIEQPVLPDDFEKQNLFIKDAILGPGFAPGHRGANLIATLKQQVANYNAAIANNKIDTEHSLLTIEPEKAWFLNSLLVLNGVTQLQLQLAGGSK